MVATEEATVAAKEVVEEAINDKDKSSHWLTDTIYKYLCGSNLYPICPKHISIFMCFTLII